MVMTRKDFAALAKALRESKATEQTVDAVATVCKASNARFDRDRFTAAAGITHAPGRSTTGEDRWND